MKAAGPEGAAVMHVHVEDPLRLHRAYMPFIVGGGLFIPTSRHYRLGDELFLVLHLPHTPDPMPVRGKVVWVTPRHAQGNRPSGIGIQFLDDEEGVLRARIETLIGGLQQSDRPTHTF